MFSAYISLKKSDLHPGHNFICKGPSFDDIFDTLVEKEINANYFFENICSVEMRHILDCECRFFISLDSFMCMFFHEENELPKVTDFLESLQLVYDNEPNPRQIDKDAFIAATREAEANFSETDDQKFCEALSGIHSHNNVKAEQL